MAGESYDDPLAKRKPCVDSFCKPKNKRSSSSLDQDVNGSSQTKPPLKKRCGNDISSTQEKVHEGKRTLRSSVNYRKKQWTEAATNTFFEGLYRHGKDFERIYNFMATKYRRMTDPLIATLTNTQVRFYYYQMWKKVSDYLACAQSTQGLSTHTQDEKQRKVAKPCSDVETKSDTAVATSQKNTEQDGQRGTNVPAEGIGSSMESQSVAQPAVLSKDLIKETVLVNGKKFPLDLVALICYGKNRRYFGAEIPKAALGNILYSLVYNGFANVEVHPRGRHRKKMKINLKFPNVRALRGQTVSDQVPGLCEVGVPVLLNLRPATSESWCHVHSLAQNPRIQMTLPSHVTVAEVIEFLTRKWKISTHHRLLMMSQKEECHATPIPTVSLPGEETISKLLTQEKGSSTDTVSLFYKIEVASSQGNGYLCGAHHKSLLAMLRIAEMMNTMEQVSAGSSKQSPTRATLSQRKPIPSSASPFRKLSHLKNSCYSARRKLDLEPQGKGKVLGNSKCTSANCSTMSEGSQGSVNLISFHKDDIKEQNFSHLNVQDIFQNLQKKIGSTPPKPTASPHAPAGQVNTVIDLNSTPAKADKETDTSITASSPDSQVPEESVKKAATHQPIKETNFLRPKEESVKKALEEIRGLSSRRRKGNIKLLQRGGPNILQRPNSHSALRVLPAGINTPANLNNSSLLLDNLVSQLKVKVLIQALLRQQQLKLVDFGSTYSLQNKQAQQQPEVPFMASPTPPTDIYQQPVQLNSSQSSLHVNHKGKRHTDDLGAAEVPAVSIPVQPPPHSTNLTTTFPSGSVTQDSIALAGFSGLFPNGQPPVSDESAPPTGELQDVAHSLSCSELLRIPETIDNHSLMDMLTQLKAVSPAKEAPLKSELSERPDLSFENLMALIESPQRNSNCKDDISLGLPSTQEGSQGKHLANSFLPAFLDEDTVDLINSIGKAGSDH